MPENRRRFRNPVARSPLLRKGGPHQRSRSGERHQMHQALEAELDEWLDERETERQHGEPVPKGTGSSFVKAQRDGDRPHSAQ
jgi:hypothetical protein